MQEGTRGLIDDMQPTDAAAVGEVLLLDGVDLPALVGDLGPLVAARLWAAGLGRGQTKGGQPAADGAGRGKGQAREALTEAEAQVVGAPAWVVDPPLAKGTAERFGLPQRASRARAVGGRGGVAARASL